MGRQTIMYIKWPNTVNSWVRYGTFAPIKVIPIVLVMTFRVVYCLCEISKLTIQRTLQTFLIHLVNLSNLTLTFRVGLRVYYYMYEIATVRWPTCCITCSDCWTDWICDASTIYYATAHYTHWQTSFVCIHLIHDIPHGKIPMVSPSRNVLYTCVGHWRSPCISVYVTHGRKHRQLT